MFFLAVSLKENSAPRRTSKGLKCSVRSPKVGPRKCGTLPISDQDFQKILLMMLLLKYGPKKKTKTMMTVEFDFPCMGFVWDTSGIPHYMYCHRLVFVNANEVSHTFTLWVPIFRLASTVPCLVPIPSRPKRLA